MALLALLVIGATPRAAHAAFAPVFRQPELFDVGAQPSCIVGGDLNGDGLPDLVVGIDPPSGRSAIAILLHYATGLYPVLYHPAVIESLKTPGWVRDVKLVDLNKDGNLDAIVSIIGSGNNDGYLAVMLGDGKGGLGNPTLYPFSTSNISNLDAQVGDVNGDGWPDVVVDDWTGSSVYVLLGTGGGALGAPVHYSMGPVEVQDATGDGIADLVNVTISGITIWPGSPAGTFNSSLPPVSIGVDPNNNPSLTANIWGDLNGDSVPDFVYSWANNGQASHLGAILGTGGGAFSAPLSYVAADTTNRVTEIELKDMDGDGKTDIVAAYDIFTDYVHTTIGVAKGNGTGAMSAPVSYLEPALFLSGWVVGDLDGDSKLDIAAVLDGDPIVGISTHCITVVRSDGSAGFAQPLLSPLGGLTSRSVAADFNRDGKLDLALADSTSGVRIGIGDGTGAFTPGITMSMPSPVKSMTAGDLDRNGTVDLITGDGVNALRFLSGVGDGSLLAPTTLPGVPATPYTTYPRSMADVNGDGRPDLVVADPGGGVYVLVQSSIGTFTATQVASLGAPINDLVLGDWNRDGYLDLAVVLSTGVGEGLDVMLGGPTGLGNPTQVAPGLFTAVCAGDFNRDGNLDLVVRQSWDGVQPTAGIFEYTGDGLGNFTFAHSIPTLDQHGYTIDAADVDHDGKLDLVAEGVFASQFYPANGEAEVHLGNGDGTFDTMPYADGLFGLMNPKFGPCTFADVDRDGTPDAIASIFTQDGIVKVSTLHINSYSKGNGLLPASFYSTVSGPRTVAVGDLNRDGKLDVVTCTPTAGTGVAVHLGNGSGTLGSSQAITGSGPASKVAIADFNRDGIPDIAALNNTVPPYGIETLLGSGGGTVFQFPIHYFFNAGADFAVGDMNRDGIPDIVAATPDSIRILYGSPLPGKFTGGPGIALPSCSHIELADLDQDGYLDVVCACGSVKVAYGAPSGFRPLVVTLPGPFTTCQTLCVADFNRDGYLDIEANQAGQWYILWGAAVSPFSTSAVSTLPFAPNDVKEGDAEANGTPYLYAARNPDQVEVLSVSPTGTIASVGSYVVKNQPGSIALGDFNRDGGLDVVSASPVDSALTINLHGAGGITGVEPIAITPPAQTRLLQNYPNPFNPRTTIRYALAREERVRLAVFDVEGRLVETLRDGEQAAGEHTVAWDGRDGGGGAVGSGVYFYQLTTESGEQESKRMILLK